MGNQLMPTYLRVATHRYITMKTLTTTQAQWAAVMDHPGQRDTEARALRAVKTYLKSLAPIHCYVHAAKAAVDIPLPNGGVIKAGALVKLDGHTRSYLWARKMLKAPARLTVTVQMVSSLQDLNSRYDEFDNANAAKTAGDRCVGAFKLAGISRDTPLLISGSWTTAMRLVPGSGHAGGGGSGTTRGIDRAIERWREEIITLGTLEGASKDTLSSTLMAAALITLRVDGADALSFWRGWIGNGGSSVSGKTDGLGALRDLALIKQGRAGAQKIRMAAGFGHGSHGERQHEVGEILGCYKKHAAGHFNAKKKIVTIDAREFMGMTEETNEG